MLKLVLVSAPPQAVGLSFMFIISYILYYIVHGNKEESVMIISKIYLRRSDKMKASFHFCSSLVIIKWFAGCSVLFVSLLIWFPWVACGEHGQTPQWIDEAVDQNNNPCCGDTDCLPLHYVEVIAQEGFLLTVVLDNQIGFIHKNSFREVLCPSDDRRSFVCFATSETHQSITTLDPCIIKKDDGTVEAKITIGCVRCVLKTICSSGNS